MLVSNLSLFFIIVKCIHKQSNDKMLESLIVAQLGCNVPNSRFQYNNVILQKVIFASFRLLFILQILLIFLITLFTESSTDIYKVHTYTIYAQSFGYLDHITMMFALHSYHDKLNAHDKLKKRKQNTKEYIGSRCKKIFILKLMCTYHLN